MKTILIHILLLIPLCICTQDSLIIETLRSNMYEVLYTDGQLGGSGAKLLEEGVKNHQFVTIGEMHGIREVGEFSEGIFRIGKKHGFRYFAVETDPWIARKLEQFAGQPLDSLKAFETRFPLAIPFYGNQNLMRFLS